jgi:hypothetical protein
MLIGLEDAHTFDVDTFDGDEPLLDSRPDWNSGVHQH